MCKHKHGRKDGSTEKRKKAEKELESQTPKTESDQGEEYSSIDDYDGYYDDRIPCDAGELARPRDYGMVKQLVLVGICFLLIVAASIAVMYLL